MSCRSAQWGRRPLARLAQRAALLALSALPTAASAHPFLDDRLALLDEQIAAEPSSGRLHLSRGSLLLDERRAHAAFADFARALELDPSLSIAHLLSAKALLADGQVEPALVATRRYLELEPRSAKGWRTLARTLEAKGLTAGADDSGAADAESEALAAFDRYFNFALDPSPDDYLERAAFQRRAKRLDEALLGLEAGVERLGPLTSLLRTALEIELERGNLAAALTEAERLAASSPQEERWQVERARLLLRLGRHDEAVAALRLAEASLARRSVARRTAPALQELAREIDELESEIPAAASAARGER